MVIVRHIFFGFSRTILTIHFDNEIILLMLSFTQKWWAKYLIFVIWIVPSFLTNIWVLRTNESLGYIIFSNRGLGNLGDLFTGYIILNLFATLLTMYSLKLIARKKVTFGLFILSLTVILISLPALIVLFN